MRRIIPIAVLLLLVVACPGPDFTPDVEGSWLLESATLDGKEIPLLETHPVIMILGAGRISGTAACNGYGGEYLVSGSVFEIPEGLAVTEMACSPAEVMEIERQFLDALLAADSFAIEDGRLVLGGALSELVFVPLEVSG